MTENTPWDCSSSWKGHRDAYRTFLTDIGPIFCIVELGVDYGFSFFSFCHDYPQAHVIGIDNFSYGDSVGARELLRTHLPKFPNGKIIEGNSADVARRWRQPETYLDIDVLHIDADHSYESVKQDFELWSPFVRPGGVVLFHDINIPNFGVRKFFDELQGRKDKHDVGPGLGVWYKDDA